MDWLGNIWLKILELRLHVLIGVCGFCVIVLLLHYIGFDYSHNLSPGVLGLMFLGAILTFCLIIAQVGKLIFDAVVAWRKKRDEYSEALEFQHGVFKFSNTLSAEELEVLSYLVLKNQQSFNADMIARVVVTLRQKNLIAIGAGVMTRSNAPFIIPPFVWNELQRRDQLHFSSANIWRRLEPMSMTLAWALCFWPDGSQLH